MMQPISIEKFACMIMENQYGPSESSVMMRVVAMMDSSSRKKRTAMKAVLRFHRYFVVLSIVQSACCLQNGWRTIFQFQHLRFC